jgi:Mannosyltransferase putative
MVINKTRNLAGVLMTCHLNTRQVRDEITYRRFHGDKESYWLAHALTSTPYHFVPGYSGAIGRITHPVDKDSQNMEVEEICTLQLLHMLESTGQPFWFNNAIVEDKGANDARYIVPSGWVGHDGRWRGGGTRFANELCVIMPESWSDHLLSQPEPVHRVEGILKWRLERIIQQVGEYDNLMEREGLLTISR